jgi:dipeptide/tripeptide permease
MLLSISVNWLAVILAAVAGMALGFVWYMVLGKQWMGALGKTREQIMSAAGNPATPFIIAAVMQLVMAYFLALLTPRVFGATTLINGLMMGFWLWLGFVITTMIINHRYQGSKWSLTVIDGGYLLGVLLLEGIVIGLFR